MNAWLDLFTFQIKGFTLVEERGRIVPKPQPGYHASGHISSSSLLKMVQEIDPDIVIPIHTEMPSFLEQLDGTQVIRPEIARPISL